MQKTEYEKFVVSALTVLVTGMSELVKSSDAATDKNKKVFEELGSITTELGRRFVFDEEDEPADDAAHEA